MRKRLPVVAVAGVALAFASAAMSREGTQPTLTVKSSRFGKVLFDGRGYVLYAFTRDGRRSTCYGACAKAWPVYYANAGLVAGLGVKRALLATTTRRDGRRQISYAGLPLYYWAGDTKPGRIGCQNATEFGGTWLVVRPSGRLVR